MASPAQFYQGDVFHARFKPRRHQFRYPVFFMRINLREMHQPINSAWFGVDVWRPLAFFQRDHGPKDGSSLLPWAQRLLAGMGANDPGGDVWLYTFPRVWGFTFKPVSFWHWHDRDGHLRLVLAEVNNTFGERHFYLLRDVQQHAITAQSQLQCSKCFHVSPFCEVSGLYRFQLLSQGDRYHMVIDYSDAASSDAASSDASCAAATDADNAPGINTDAAILHTSFSGQPLPFTAQSAVRLLLRQPLMTLGVVFRIHWQALRLWIKGVPFFRKPSPPTAEVSS